MTLHQYVTWLFMSCQPGQLIRVKTQPPDRPVNVQDGTVQHSTSWWYMSQSVFKMAQCNTPPADGACPSQRSRRHGATLHQLMVHVPVRFQDEALCWRSIWNEKSKLTFRQLHSEYVFHYLTPRTAQTCKAGTSQWKWGAFTANEHRPVRQLLDGQNEVLSLLMNTDL